MSIKQVGKILKNPLFFLVRGKWIERNEPLIVLDVSEDLDSALKRVWNEDADYVLIGFRIPQPSKREEGK